jgi:hypothetical protein
MANITRIDAQIKTTGSGGAGTDGDVYLAIGGREFYIDSDSEDFDANGNRTYTFGNGANVKFANTNNPSTPFQLLTEDLNRYPVYLRFHPRDRDDNWNLSEVDVKVNPGPGEVRFRALAGNNNLWLGTHSGLYCYLTRS